MWIRKAFFQVHLWAGVLLALYVVAIGVSGSILVFKEELMPKPRVRVGHLDYNGCTPEKLMQMVARADTAIPGMTTSLTACPTPANSLYTITVHALPVKRSGSVQGGRGGPKVPQRSVYLNPNTGEIVGDAERERSWVETVEQFHVNLLLGRGGRLWNGVGAAVLLAVTITGMVLWWPGIRNWSRGLRVDFRMSWKRINFDLHSAMGFWTIFFTFTWAVTGVYFTWPTLITTPLGKVSQSTTANYPAAQIKAAMAKLTESTFAGGEREGERALRRADGQGTVPPNQPPSLDVIPHTERKVDVSGMLAQAATQSPDGHLEGFFYGTGSHAIFTVYMARAILGDYSNTDFVYFDQRSGRHLYTWHRGQNHTFADWAQWLIAPLHFGTSWGQSVKVLWCLLGLALPALTMTGLLMYWNRWLSKRWRKLMH